MSLLEKLKDLVSSIEDDEELQEELQERLEGDVAELSELILNRDKEEQNTVTEEKENNDTEIVGEAEAVPSSPPDSAECDAEETLEVLAILQEGNILKSQLANLVLQYEEKKRLIFGHISENNKSLYACLDSLRQKYNIPEDGYTIEIPDKTGGKNVTFAKESN